MPASPTLELEALDRLEQKVRLLIATLERVQAEHAKLTQTNVQLQNEVGRLRSQMAESAQAVEEAADLREEREVIRDRVAGLLRQLESLPL